jgi:hypothetical protein
LAAILAERITPAYFSVFLGDECFELSRRTWNCGCANWLGRERMLDLKVTARNLEFAGTAVRSIVPQRFKCAGK